MKTEKQSKIAVFIANTNGFVFEYCQVSRPLDNLAESRTRTILHLNTPNTNKLSVLELPLSFMFPKNTPFLVILKYVVEMNSSIFSIKNDYPFFQVRSN